MSSAKAGVGERIHSVRREAGLNQLEFSKRLGVQQQHVSNLERGIKLPSDQVIRSVCREFGIEEAWLRDGHGPKRRPVEELIKEELARYGERTYLEVLMSLAKAKQYDEVFARFFSRAQEAREPGATYAGRDPDLRYRTMLARLERIYRAGNEQTIAAIEFILRQSDPEEE